MGLKKAFPIYSCDLSLTALEKYVTGSDVGSQYLKKPFPGPWFVAVNLHYPVPVS